MIGVSNSHLNLVQRWIRVIKEFFERIGHILERDMADVRSKDVSGLGHVMLVEVS